MRTLDDLTAIVAAIQFRDWKFIVKTDKGRPYLQIEFVAKDNHDPHSLPERQRSRKWWLSFHMCPNEIIRTAYKAVKTAVEHEMDEQFTLCGQPIFNPHTNYYQIAQLMETGKLGIDVR